MGVYFFDGLREDVWGWWKNGWEDVDFVGVQVFFGMLVRKNTEKYVQKNKISEMKWSEKYLQ